VQFVERRAAAEAELLAQKRVAEYFDQRAADD
jgi:hypothetical protein